MNKLTLLTLYCHLLQFFSYFQLSFAHSCIENFACVSFAGNTLNVFSGNIESSDSCRLLCQKTHDCEYFTWYDEYGAFPSSCFLYNHCRSIDKTSLCRHCYSGPRNCDSFQPDCTPIRHHYGGNWFCFPPLLSLRHSVPHGTRCIFKCSDHVGFHSCNEGRWSSEPTEREECKCSSLEKTLGSTENGDLICWPPIVNRSSSVVAGTYCLHTCHGHTKEETRCMDGAWSPSSFSCEESSLESLTPFITESTSPVNPYRYKIKDFPSSPHNDELISNQSSSRQVDDFHYSKKVNEKEWNLPEAPRRHDNNDSLNAQFLISLSERKTICSKPAENVVRNGYFECSTGYSVHSSCRLICHPGYLPKSSDTMICRSHGDWSSSEPLECVTSVALLLGGWNPNLGLLSNVEVYHPTLCSHVNISSLPSPSKGLFANWVNGALIACGGENESQVKNMCWKYDSKKNEWTEIGGLKSERIFASSAVLQSRHLFVFGGRNGALNSSPLGSTELLNLTQGSWNSVPLMELSTKRAYHCSVVNEEGSIVLIGGISSFHSIYPGSEVFRIRESSRRWRPHGFLKTPRYLHSCLMTPSGILISGGYSNTYLSSSELFNFTSESWETVGSLSLPRQGGGMVHLNGKATIIGGFHSLNSYPSLVEQFDEGSRNWSSLSKGIQIPRRYFALVSVPHTLFGRQCDYNQ